MAIPDEHFHFHLKLVFDRLSVPFVILTFALVGVIGAFADKYMHREPGFRRFFVYYAIFLFGMVLTSLAGTIECLFAGWELVGLSSALLIAFFHDRQSPVRNGLRVWTVYRFADAAFLIAADFLHHLKSGGDFDLLMGQGVWPDGAGRDVPGNGIRDWTVAAHCRGGKIGPGPIFGLGSPGDGRSNAFQRGVLTVRCPFTWGVSPAPR